MSRVPRNRIVYKDDTINPADPASTTQDLIKEDVNLAPDTTTRVLLRRVFFLNEENSRYISFGFYPGNNNQVPAEIGVPRIAPLTLTNNTSRL